MFGWRRKNDGFVWNEYVRTTVLVRREERRRRLEDVREAAVEGVKHAGRQSLALSAASARTAGGGLWWGLRSFALTAYDWISAATVATGLWTLDRAGRISRFVVSASNQDFSPFASHLRRPVVTALLVVVAIMAILSAAGRFAEHGLDGIGLLAAVLATIALAALIVPKSAEIAAAMDSAARQTGIDHLVPALPRGAKVGAAVLGFGLAGAGGLALLVWLGSVFATTAGRLDGNADSATRPATGIGTWLSTGLATGNGRIEGKAVVASGTRLKVSGVELVLSGVESPAATQTCGPRSCASNAKSALQKLVQGKRLSCTPSGKDDDGVTTATCQIDGADLAAQLVRGGHVFSETGYFATYASAEREAKNQRLGVWRTSSERPAEHRSKVWEEAKKGAPEGCPIKGTVTGDAKIYVLPWAQNYEKARVRTGRGERWFCSEADARKAGFRAGDTS